MTEPVLVANALVSLAETRTYLQIDSNATKPGGDLLAIMINGISERVVQYTGRCYINSDAEDDASARVFESAGDKTLQIDDCREATTVEVTAEPNNEDNWETLNATEAEYVMEPFGHDVVNRIRFASPANLPSHGVGWSAVSLVMRDPTRTEWPRETQAEVERRTYIRITAKWGLGPDLTTVPSNVKLAVLMWVQNINKRDQAFFSDQVAKVIAKMEMPPDVKDILDGESDDAPMVTAV